MISFRALCVVLLVTYVAGVLACRWLVYGAFAIDRPTIAAMLIVPVVQALVLVGWRRLSTRRSAR